MLPIVGIILVGHQCLTVRDDRPCCAIYGFSIGVKQIKGVAEAAQHEIVHREHGTVIRVQEHLGCSICFRPQTVETDESTVAIGVHDGPSTDVEWA